MHTSYIVQKLYITVPDYTTLIIETPLIEMLLHGSFASPLLLFILYVTVATTTSGEQATPRIAIIQHG